MNTPSIYSFCFSAYFELLPLCRPLSSISKKLGKKELNTNHFGFLSVSLAHCSAGCLNEGGCQTLPGFPSPSQGSQM